MWAFAVAGSRCFEVVPEFRADDEIVELSSGKSVCENRFAVTIAVCRGGVEEGDAEVARFSQQLNTEVLVCHSPPRRRNAPNAETDL